MGIVLSVLKVIGIILLCILALLLILLLIVLFVPIRYKANGFYEDKKACLNAKVTYLLHIVTIYCKYDSKLEYGIKLFGIRVNLDRFLNKKNSSENKKSLKEEKVTEEVVSEENVAEKKATSKVVTEEKNALKTDSEKAFKDCESVQEDKKNSTNKNNTEKETFVDKINNIKFEAEFYKELLTNPSTKVLLMDCKILIGKLLKSILPKKGRIDITVGLENAGITGEILGYYNALYPFIGHIIHFYPVFDDKIIETEFKIKGRIIPVVIVVNGLKLLFNKNFKRVIKLYKNKNKWLEARKG